MDEDSSIRVEAWIEVDLVAIVQTGKDLEPQVLTLSPKAAIELAKRIETTARSVKLGGSREKVSDYGRYST